MATILAVDDSASMRQMVSFTLKGAGFDVTEAGDGQEALEKAKSGAFDLVLSDVNMPVMDGITAIKHIMAESPCPILMFSSLTHEGARVTLDALDAGAVDFLPKNFEDIAGDASKMQEVLRSRILSIANKALFASRTKSSEVRQPISSAQKQSLSSANPIASSTSERLKALADQASDRRHLRDATSTHTATQRVKGTNEASGSGHQVDVLAIGTSTGGPVALQKIITKLPANFPVPILLVQHMPATFTPAFAERLNSLSQIKVKQAEEGDVLEAGVAYLAPGGMQMIVGARGGRKMISILEGDARLTYKPSVDVTFGSLAKAYPGKVLSLVLTGMGADGKEGCRMMKANGSTVWTQSEATCVVYGMPMMVDKSGYSDRSLDIDVIAEQIVNRLG